jgi:hypothetical protein
VFWIGGPPGSGKTTVARRLARRHGLRLYSADTRTWAHRDRALADGSEAAEEWERLSVEARGAASPDKLVAMSLHRERGPMAIDDLRRLPSAPLIVAEGATLPASAVSSGIADPARSIWLIPTKEFQQRALADLPGTARTLYSLLGDVIAAEAHEHDVRILRVDGSRGVDETAESVDGLFAAAIAEGPRAESVHERVGLLREANEAIVDQVRGYYGRAWAEGDPDHVLRTFVCECGDPECIAEVETTVGEASARPVLDVSHG